MGRRVPKASPSPRMKRNRLHSMCPYFAMFPESFVRTQVESYTKPGDLVFDPFSGRGTTLLESLLLGRRAMATDINPVAYCISGAKAVVPKLAKVLSRLTELEERLNSIAQQEYIESLPKFFSCAYEASTLTKITFLRGTLSWQRNHVDRFIAALVLGSLHGEADKSSSYFSNQMPRTISTKPEYSIRYWRKHRLTAAKRDVFQVLRDRARLRLSGSTPLIRGSVALADVREASKVFQGCERQVNLVVTSPPYLDVTRYEEDQWLRLWFLGRDPFPTYSKISSDDRHTAPTKYWEFLRSAWKGFASMLAPKSVIVCRIGAKDLTVESLSAGITETLKSALPSLRLLRNPAVSKIRNRQTDYFHPGTKGCLCEVDFAFQLR